MNFYKQFCRELFSQLGGDKAVWSITMGDQAATGHSLLGEQHMRAFKVIQFVINAMSFYTTIPLLILVIQYK